MTTFTPEVLAAYKAPIARLTVAAAAAWVQHEQAKAGLTLGEQMAVDERALNAAKRERDLKIMKVLAME